jgi:hypothetical protein
METAHNGPGEAEVIVEIIEIVELEEHAKHHGTHAPHARHYAFRVDKTRVVVETPTITGAEILAKVGKTEAEFKLYQHKRGHQPILIGPDHVVHLREPGVERFTTMPKDTTEGREGPCLRQAFRLPATDEEYTSERWRDELDAFIRRSLEAERARVEDLEDDGLVKAAAKRGLLVAERSTPERWLNTLLDIIHVRWGGWPGPKSKVLKRMFVDDDYDSIEFPFSDDLCFLRAAVDRNEDLALVKFEFESAVSELDIDPDTKFSVNARRDALDRARALEKIVVLTEGRSDSRILLSSLERIFPHLKHMYSFLDHSSFRAPGGVGDLERLARGFAGAGVSNRVIAIFDNDTAGVAAAQRLLRAGLPATFRVLVLPDLEFARSYPTLGPTGPIDADINGRACGIELYCGPAALTGDDGQFCPVQWTGYDSALKRYQGEPLEKEKIKERFYEVLANSSDPATDPELASIQLIFNTIMELKW